MDDDARDHATVCTGGDEGGELFPALDDHQDKHEGDHEQADAPRDTDEDGDGARGCVQRLRDAADQLRGGRHRDTWYLLANLGGHGLGVISGCHLDHDRGDDAVGFERRVLVESLAQ